MFVYRPVDNVDNFLQIRPSLGFTLHRPVDDRGDEGGDNRRPQILKQFVPNPSPSYTHVVHKFIHSAFLPVQQALKGPVHLLGGGTVRPAVPAQPPAKGSLGDAGGLSNVARAQARVVQYNAPSLAIWV